MKISIATFIHAFGCVMLIPESFPPLNAAIQDSELYLDPKDPSYGKSNPHVTSIYGIRELDASSKIYSLLKKVKLDYFTLTGASCFYCDDYDVVKMDVVNEGCVLEFRNLLTQAFPDFENTHGDYKPHLTLAYVKKGLGDSICERYKDFQKASFKISQVEYSQQNGQSNFFQISSSQQPSLL